MKKAKRINKFNLFDCCTMVEQAKYEVIKKLAIWRSSVIHLVDC